MRDSSNLLVDPLSDLLNFLQVRCDLSGRLVAGGTWARRFANLDAIKFCAVTEGGCWYSSDGMSEPARVDAGDVLITNGTRTLTLASTAALIPNATTTPVVRDSDDQYQLGQGCDFTMLGGIVQIDTDQQALLLNGLPRKYQRSRADFLVAQTTCGGNERRTTWAGCRHGRTDTSAIRSGVAGLFGPRAEWR